jgi:endoglycosylceramidase
MKYLKAVMKALKNPKENRWYISDKDGRIVIYRGLDISNYSKTCNGGKEGLTWHTSYDFQRMATEWGFNLARLLVFWDAIEPQKGIIDQNYLNGIVDKIKQMQQCGIDVIVDLHQDLYNTKFTGNGFPSWAVNDEGIPFVPQQPWNLNYLQKAVYTSYNNFWNNPPLQDAYVNVIKVFLQNVEGLNNVVGIDVMNEPFPGTHIDFEPNYLTPLYNRIQEAFKDSTKYMCFEPWMSTSAGLPTFLTFKPNYGIYSPHFYDPFCHEGAKYGWWNRLLMRGNVFEKIMEANKFHSSLWFGEWGVGQKVINYEKYIEDFCNLADTLGFHWTYYSYDKANDGGFGVLKQDGSEDLQLKLLIRIFPQKISGYSPKFSYKNKRFVLSYNPSGNDLPTVIFIPDRVQNVVIKVDGKLIEIQQTGKTFEYVNKSIDRSTIEITHD